MYDTTKHHLHQNRVDMNNHGCVDTSISLKQPNRLLNEHSKPNKASLIFTKRKDNADILVKSSQKRKVSFGHVETRLYGLTLGDNPSCTCGPPTTLTWDYAQGDKLDVSSYESRKQSPTKRDLRSFHMSTEVREELLKSKGFTSNDFYHTFVKCKENQTSRNAINDDCRNATINDLSRYFLGALEETHLD